MRITIDARTAKDVLSMLPSGGPYIGSDEDVVRAIRAELERALSKRPPRRSKKTAKERKATSSIRTEVFKRAGGCCECGCGRSFSDFDPGQLDHFLGRGKAPQSVENCWALMKACHLSKTRNSPTAAYWLRIFVNHQQRYGYDSRRAQNRLLGMIAVREAESSRLSRESEAGR